MRSIERITYVPIESVKPYENNPRYNDNGVAALAESIKQFGWTKPIVVDAQNVIIAGHTRLKAAQLLGLKEVPVSVADWLTEEQAKAYRLADNKSGELAEWDYDKLVEEIQKAKNTDFSALGFSEIELMGLSNDFLPDGFGDEEGYEEIGEAQLKAKHITINYDAEDEEEVKELIGEKGELKVVYKASEIMQSNANDQEADTD